MSVKDYESERDLRVPGDVGAAIRLGLAEIAKKTAVSTPLSTPEAIKHMRYELAIIEDSFVTAHALANSERVRLKGKDGAR